MQAQQANTSAAGPHGAKGRLVRSKGRPGRLLAGLRYRIARVCRRPANPAPLTLLQKLNQHDPEVRQLSFTFAVIALCARVACADGLLSARKYALFRECFPLQDDMSGKLRALFSLACETEAPLASFVAQVRYAFPGHKGLLASLLDRLFRIACADGELSASSEAILAQIAHGMDIDAKTYDRTLARYMRPGQPHQVLGLHKRASRETVKARYRELMKQYHPDRHAGTPLSHELELLFQLKTAEINAAYNHLSRQAA